MLVFRTKARTHRVKSKGKIYVYMYLPVPRNLADKLEPGKEYVVMISEK